nr:Dam family site-specific DNA-(adenine-N6)-methyltransferase [Clostridium sp. DMHC 10]
MFNEIIPRVPKKYEKYIEPFIGGGALFFKLGYSKSIIADSNPELINLYKQLAANCDQVIEELQVYKNTEEMYYEVRAKDWLECAPIEAAARMLYLNKTCFNGLYRLNKKGKFNTPFGRYKNPTICNPDKLHAAAEVLKNTTIICGDYLEVLETYATEGDFIFLDPPYMPISNYSDFKRYTKEQFYEQDQVNLAQQVHRLYEKGCYVLLTNSNHPLIHELYKDFKIDIIQTKRSINSKSNGRTGEDIIVTAYPN